MTIYKIIDDKINRLNTSTFASQGLTERKDLQAMLKSQIEVIAPDCLVVSEEFGEWEDSRRRIDLLAIDKDANLVVIELKRTVDGGHMELQAIRYAAMISTLTFDQLVKIYGDFIAANNLSMDARETLLEFLSWEEPDEDNFGQEVKIVLASGDFSKELTTSVMWLNDFGLDIRCVRLQPYDDSGITYIDVQTVIPIPEVADYQVKIRQKKQRERQSRAQNRDYTKYDLNVVNSSYERLSKRWLVYQAVKALIDAGISPEDVKDCVPWRRNRLFIEFDGVLSSPQVVDRIMEGDVGGQVARANRYFSKEGEPFHFEGRTYVLSNQWGAQTIEAIENMKKAFPEIILAVGESSGS